jgi:hypothetical protein
VKLGAFRGQERPWELFLEPSTPMAPTKHAMMSD